MVKNVLSFYITIEEIDLRDVVIIPGNVVVVVRLNRAVLFPLVEKQPSGCAHIDHNLFRHKPLDALEGKLCGVVEVRIAEEVVSFITDDIGIRIKPLLDPFRFPLLPVFDFLISPDADKTRIRSV